MSPKDLLLDFINLVFTIILVAFCIIYFIAGDRFAVFTIFLKSMVPLAFFGIIFLIRIKIIRLEIRSRNAESKTEIVLYLNIFHKLLSDIIVFGSPIILGFLIYLMNGKLNKADIVLLIFVFLTMFLWQRYLFSKER